MNRPALTIVSSGGTLTFGALDIGGMVFSTGEHGAEMLSAVVAVQPKSAITLLDRIGTPDVWVHAYGAIIWRGRLEDAQIVDEGMQITAYGYWRSLSDVPYTALWSATKTSDFVPVTSTINSNRVPELFKMDNNNRLFVQPEQTPIAVGQEGTFAYYAPYGGSRKMTNVSFDYTLTAIGTNWKARVVSFDEGFINRVEEWSLTGSGSTQTGSASVTFAAARDHVSIGLYASFINTPAADDSFIATNIRVKTTTSATVTPSAIASDLIASGAQLDTSTALIATNSIDLRDEVYEDAYPADILTRLAGLGDASGNRWEVGVDNQKRLYYRQVGTGAREWFLNAESIQLQRSLSDLRNSVYAVYSDANNRAIRGTTSTNTTSTDRYGVTRRAALGVSTTNSTQADYHRDVYLADNKDLTPKAAFKVRSIYGLGISPAPPFLVKAGDYVTVNNLPPSPDNALNKSRRFRITRTEYDCESGELTIEPEAPLPSLDFLVAREAVGLGPRYRHSNPAMGRIRRG